MADEAWKGIPLQNNKMAVKPELESAIFRQFFSMIPWKDIHWRDKNTKLSTREQEDVISCIFHSSLMEKYPPSKSYQKHFLKNIISQLENSEVEIWDSLYVMYAGMVQEKDTGEQTCYRSYFTGPDVRVTLKESILFLSEGTTGLRTWEAAFYLTEWLLGEPLFLNAKSVIELGSGLGMVGTSVLRSLHPSHFTFTDCHRGVLDQLRANVELNASEEPFHCKEYSVESLDWRESENNPVLQKHYDIVLASDVVFDTALVDSLVRVLSIILRLKRDSVGVIATTVRNEGTNQCFKAALESQSLKFNLLTTVPVTIPTLYYNRCAQYELLFVQTK